MSSTVVIGKYYTHSACHCSDCDYSLCDCRCLYAKVGVTPQTVAWVLLPCPEGPPGGTLAPRRPARVPGCSAFLPAAAEICAVRRHQRTKKGDRGTDGSEGQRPLHNLGAPIPPLSPRRAHHLVLSL